MPARRKSTGTRSFIKKGTGPRITPPKLDYSGKPPGPKPVKKS